MNYTDKKWEFIFANELVSDGKYPNWNFYTVMEFPVANSSSAHSADCKVQLIKWTLRHGSISIKQNVIVTEAKEHIAWSWLPSSQCHKTPFPRITTEFTQLPAPSCCGQKSPSESKRITVFGHGINIRRITRSQPTWSKGGLEVSVILYIPSTWMYSDNLTV